MVEAEYCRVSGDIPTENCPKAKGFYRPSNTPSTYCTVCNGEGDAFVDGEIIDEEAIVH
jgi:hypothetical protein